MRYYPVSLNIEEKNCLIVGGGAVGTRKAKTLLKYGAVVTVLSEVFSDNLQAQEGRENIQLINKPYAIADLDGKFIVMGATDNKQLNDQIARDAKKRGILCNIADFPEASDFILPSIVNRGDLTITISTAGSSPALAKKLRRDLADQFGEEYALFLHLMGAIRKKLLAEKHDPETHKGLFKTLVESNLLELAGQNDIKNIDKLLQKTLGGDFLYKYLINQ